MNIKQLENFVANFLPISHTLVLEANHGVGKSEIIRNNIRAVIAKKHGVPVEEVDVIDRRAAQMDPADLIGGIFLVGGRTFNAPPSWLPVSKDSSEALKGPLESNGMVWTDFVTAKYGILFVDELNRASPHTRQAFFELTLDRSLHGVKIPDTWYIMAAINGNGDLYEVPEIEPAAQDRQVTVKFQPSFEELFQYFDSSVEDGKIHGSVVAYIKQFEDCIDPSDDIIEKSTAEGTKTFSRRSWYRLGQSLVEFEKNSGQDILDTVTTRDGFNIIRAAAESYVGPSQASAFASFVKEEYDVVSPAAILNKMDSSLEKRIRVMAGIDDNGDLIDFAPGADKSNVPALSGIANALYYELAKIKSTPLTKKQHRNITKFLYCLPREVVSGFWNNWASDGDKGEPADATRAQALAWHTTPLRRNVTTRSVIPEAAYQKWVASLPAQGITDIFSDEPMKPKK